MRHSAMEMSSRTRRRNGSDAGNGRAFSPSPEKIEDPDEEGTAQRERMKVEEVHALESGKRQIGECQRQALTCDAPDSGAKANRRALAPSASHTVWMTSNVSANGIEQVERREEDQDRVEMTRQVRSVAAQPGTQAGIPWLGLAGRCSCHVANESLRPVVEAQDDS